MPARPAPHSFQTTLTIMKHKPMWTIAAGGVLLLTVAACALPAGRGKYESPDYQVEAADGAFEVRDYPTMTVVSTSMTTDDDRRNSAFMKLFRYISGQNEKDQKISMTTPVFSTRQSDTASMSFVVPAEVAKAGAPAANDESVTISERKGGRFAVYRYSGRWTDELNRAATEKLAAWIAEQGLRPIGEPETANYDPPYTPPPFRRNEVLVRIAK